jgi:hypothetical protein
MGGAPVRSVLVALVISLLSKPSKDGNVNQVLAIVSVNRVTGPRLSAAGQRDWAV